MSSTTAERIERLTTAAARRVVEPDEEVRGELGSGQVLPDDLLSIAGLGLDLSDDQRRRLAREEIASITKAGIRFEAVLEAGFAIHLATAEDLGDPRWTFILHEVGEETRHQRLFQRLLDQLGATARSPIPMRVIRLGYRLAIDVSASNPALFYTLVLAGEEIPDLIQKIASEHPATDPFVKAVNRYHRMEEARHLSFARAVLPEVWEGASAFDRALVRHVAPRVISFMFHDLVHPGVYAAVGLPGLATWRKVKSSPRRRQLRYDATRPILDVLLACGAVERRAVPTGWRELCGLDRTGRPSDCAPSAA